MEESSSHHHLNHDASRLGLRRSGVMNVAKFLSLAAVGLAGFAGMQLANIRPAAERQHHSLRASYMDPFDSFEREMQQVSMSNCTLDCCKQFQADICGSSSSTTTTTSPRSLTTNIPFGVQILLIIFLLCSSAMFSGLTLGLMSLDKTGLEIVMGGDDPDAARYAKIIYPIRDNGNLLLCTLLLGNVLSNTLLSILMADYTGGVIGLFSSTFLIVIFSEILPQALVSLRLRLHTDFSGFVQCLFLTHALPSTSVLATL